MFWGEYNDEKAFGNEFGRIVAVIPDFFNRT